MKPPNRHPRFALLVVTLLLGGGLGHLATKAPASEAAPPPSQSDDKELVRSLLGEHLSDRTFAFATIAEACSGKKVLPLTDDPAHQRVTAAIHQALKETLAELNLASSPVRQLRRINEASKFFEDGLHARINRMPGLKCEVPLTRDGEHQRSGYPDLKITDLDSKLVFYLDPKLVEQGSAESTFRTFYFEPKNETLKINDDAVHLLVGIEHDGKEREWTFTGWRLIDLSSLRVRLKAEFQASNAELYQKSKLSLPDSAR
ncbi:MAG: hypothetical protein ABI162_05200 [Luteolibacter sp.]